MKKILYYSAAAVLVLILAIPVFSNDINPKEKADKTAPDFALKDITGKEWKLSDLRGKKVVLLEFGRIGCPACHEAVKGLKELDKKYAPKGLQVLTVNMDGPMWNDIVKSYVKDEKIGYPVLRDSDKKIGSLYRVQYIPHIMLIDLNGVVRFSQPGYSRETIDTLSKKLESLLPKQEK